MPAAISPAGTDARIVTPTGSISERVLSATVSRSVAYARYITWENANFPQQKFPLGNCKPELVHAAGTHSLV